MWMSSEGSVFERALLSPLSARWAESAPLATERGQLVVAAVAITQAQEAVGQDAAFEEGVEPRRTSEPLRAAACRLNLSISAHNVCLMSVPLGRACARLDGPTLGPGLQGCASPGAYLAYRGNHAIFLHLRAWRWRQPIATNGSARTLYCRALVAWPGCVDATSSKGKRMSVAVLTSRSAENAAQFVENPYSDGNRAGLFSL